MTDQYFTWDVDEALHCIDLQYAQGAARVRTYFTHDADMHQVRRDDVFNSVHKYVTHALDGDRWAYVRSDIADPTWLQSTGPSVYDSFLSFCLIADPDWGVAPNQCYTYDALGSEFAPEERSDAFGTGGGLGVEFGYRDYLSTTALYQLWHRWYDPATGRFVSRDPIARHGVTAYR